MGLLNQGKKAFDDSIKEVIFLISFTACMYFFLSNEWPCD